MAADIQCTGGVAKLRDQRAVRGVEELVRGGDPDQLVPAIAAVLADEGDLGVLAVGVVQLTIALDDRAAQ